MQSQVYHLSRKLFSQKTRNKLKSAQSKVRNKLAPMYKLRFGSFTADDLQAELSAKLPDFDILMVHSSYYNLLPMYSGKLIELMNMLLNFCTPERTLVMPAFYFGTDEYPEDYFKSIVKHYQDNPTFNVSRTPSQSGMLSEIFRHHPGVQSSWHPIHRISAVGPLAEELVKDHNLCEASCGKGSPFDKMMHHKTLILGVGVLYYRCLTQTHAAEDLLLERDEYPTKFAPTKLPVVLTDKTRKKVDYTLTLYNKDKYHRRIHPYLKTLVDEQDLFEWTFHGVPLFYANAERVTQALIDTALQGHSLFTEK